MIILFDVDRTIFDNSTYSKLYENELAKILGLSDTNKLKEAKIEYRSLLRHDREFTPEAYVKMICNRFSFDKPDLLLEVIYGTKYSYVYKDSVYPEAIELFKKLKNQGCKLGLYSEATKRFQEHKVKSMEIGEYIDKDLVFIFDAKDNDEALSVIPKDAIVIDDKERVCDFLLSRGRKSVWINRIDERVNPNYPTIHSLLDLPQVLTSID